MCVGDCLCVCINVNVCMCMSVCSRWRRVVHRNMSLSVNGFGCVFKRVCVPVCVCVLRQREGERQAWYMHRQEGP